VSAFRRFRRRVLEYLGRFEGPLAYAILGTGVATFLATVAGIIATGDAKWATLIAAAIFAVDGYHAVQEYEDRLGS
jgi:4-hydroxybenzoate polyprenyltransferase